MTIAQSYCHTNRNRNSFSQPGEKLFMGSAAGLHK
jgi:hypothetical protein